MIRTRVGYAGGDAKDPTYRQIADHTEVFQVDYDPDRVSFAKLLEVFWSSHNPCRAAWSTQYQAILFYHDEDQRRVAEASRNQIQAERGDEVRTAVRSLDRFYWAEDYHQKYYLRRKAKLFAALQVHFPDERELVNSTAAARLNAYCGGDLSYARLRPALAEVGLRAVGEEQLLGIEAVAAPPADPDAAPPGQTAAATGAENG